MRKVAMGLVAVAVLLLGSSLSAKTQSLAVIARKERERRAQLDGKSPVIGETELANGEGSTFSLTGARSDQGEAVAEQETPAERRDAPELSEKEIRDLREKWYHLWRERMGSAREELDKSRDDVYQCRSAESFFFVPLAIDCVGVEDRLDDAEARLKEVQANRYNWELLLPR